MVKFKKDGNSWDVIKDGEQIGIIALYKAGFKFTPTNFFILDAIDLKLISVKIISLNENN